MSKKIIIIVLCIIVVVSCQQKNNIDQNNRIIKSLMQINQIDYPTNIDSDYEKQLLENIKNLDSLKKASFEVRYIYFVKKSAEISAEIRDYLLDKTIVNDNNYRKLIDIYGNQNYSDHTREMALNDLKIYLIEEDWPSLLVSESKLHIVEEYIMSIKNVLINDDKMSERLKGEFYSAVIDILSLPERGSTNMKKIRMVLDKTKLKSFFYNIYSDEPNNGIKVFMTYYFIFSGEKRSLQWIINNYSVLKYISIKDTKDTKTNQRQDRLQKNNWEVAPPLYFIKFNRYIENSVSDKGIKVLSIPYILRNYTNKSFKTAEQWQNWFNKNKDNIVWDAEKKKYIVK